MGERMMFTVKRGGKTLCGIYYHWSAYTQSVYCEAKYLLDGLKKRGYSKDSTDDETLKMLIRTLVEDSINDWTAIEGDWHVSHGGCEDSRANLMALKKRFPDEKPKFFFGDKSSLSRSNGLLAIDEGAINNMAYWAAEEIFDMDTETVTNGFFDHWNNIPEHLADCIDEGEGEGIKIVDFIKPDFDYENVPFDKIDDVVRWYADNVADKSGFFFDKDTEEYIEVKE